MRRRDRGESAARSTESFQVISQVMDRNPGLSKDVSVDSVEMIAQYSGSWIRDPVEFRPSAKHRTKFLHNFVHYLFVEYEMPRFMSSAWLTRDLSAIELFIALGRGESARKSIHKAFGFPLTKSENHRFVHHEVAKESIVEVLYRVLMTNDALSTEQALVRAQLIEMRFHRIRGQGAFVADAIRWFGKFASQCESEEVGPVCDYLQYCLEDNGGQLSFQGLTMKAVLRDMERWHRILGQMTVAERDNVRYLTAFQGPYLGVQFVQGGPIIRGELITATNYESWKDVVNLTKRDSKKRYAALYSEAPKPQGAKPGRKVWITVITQITSLRELVVEGNVMRHCVASYDHRIRDSRSHSIWSMKRFEGRLCMDSNLCVEFFKTVEMSRELTIEIANNTLIQACGACNAYPTGEQNEHLWQWADQEGINGT